MVLGEEHNKQQGTHLYAADKALAYTAKPTAAHTGARAAPPHTISIKQRLDRAVAAHPAHQAQL